MTDPTVHLWAGTTEPAAFAAYVEERWGDEDFERCLFWDEYFDGWIDHDWQEAQREEVQPVVDLLALASYSDGFLDRALASAEALGLSTANTLLAVYDGFDDDTPPRHLPAPGARSRHLPLVYLGSFVFPRP